MVQGPTARMCRLSVSSWGAEVSVKGWYSVVPRARQAIRTHCPDLYSKPWGRWNCRWVTPEEGRWAGGCCPKPSNNTVASRELPHLHAQLCFWNITGEVSPQSEVIPHPHVYPEEELSNTRNGGQWARGSPTWAPPLCCKRGSGSLAKSFSYQLFCS